MKYKKSISPGKQAAFRDFPLLYLAFVAVKTGIECVEVLGVEFILYDAQCFAEPLEVDDFAGTEKFNWFTDLLVVNQTQDIVVSSTGFLFCHTIVNTTLYERKTNQYLAI